MIFWICLAIFIGSIIWGFIDDWYDGTPIFLSVVFGFIVLICAGFIIVDNSCSDGYLTKELAKREGMVYQLETNMYDNDNDIGKRELMEEITTWNANIASNKCLQNNFWVGIFIPDIYDQVDLIELKY